MNGIMNDKNNEVLLSICIPTYNRAKQLDTTLKSIISQNIFINTNKIEIVISDNCSTDETSLIVNKYILNFPNKIIYSRNDIDIVDRNFEKVLSLGTGFFLKLNNDTLKHNSKSLETIIAIIEKKLNQKPVLFFSNGVLKKYKIIQGQGLEFLLTTATYFSTWIATFGIWKEDFDKIINFNKASHLKLTQVDILFDLIKKKKNIIIDDEILFDPEVVSKKGGYDIVTVFLDNYSYLLKQQLDLNEISDAVYYKEMDSIINNFLAIWLAKSFVDYQNFNFILNKPLRRINKFYSYNLLKLFGFYKNLIKQCLSEMLVKLRSKKYA